MTHRRLAAHEALVSSDIDTALVVLTPSEDLVMEVLAARYRTGERLWTFESRHRRTIDSLADKGLVSPLHGIVENTVRASLTETGIATCLSQGFKIPLVREIESLLNAAFEAGDKHGRYSDQWVAAIQDLRTALDR